MGDKTDVLVVFALFAGLAGGWATHAAWITRRVTVRPVRRYWPDGPIVSWVVNLGRPIVGHFTSREEAAHHSDRIRNAVNGRADTKRRTTDERKGEAGAGGEGAPAPAD